MYNDYIIKGTEVPRFFVFTDKGAKKGPYYAGNSFFIAYETTVKRGREVFSGRNIEVGIMTRKGRVGFAYQTRNGWAYGLPKLERLAKSWAGMSTSETFYVDSHIRELTANELMVWLQERKAVAARIKKEIPGTLSVPSKDDGYSIDYLTYVEEQEAAALKMTTMRVKGRPPLSVLSQFTPEELAKAILAQVK